MLNRFATEMVVFVLGRLKDRECQLKTERQREGGDKMLPESVVAEDIAELADARGLFGRLQFGFICERINAAIAVIEEDASVARSQAEFAHVSEVILHELGKKVFLVVAADRQLLVNGADRSAASAVGNFPSAVFDYIEAGNCLAAECNTGAVLNVMRVAEVGLRALAWDRRIKLPKKALMDFATWEDIIKELEKAEQAIQGYRKTRARESQFAFYHGAMMEFRAFKNAWRNRLMHGREEQYDRDQAHSVFVHVRTFMEILGKKIAEGKRTPLVWKKP